jgi:outer membrane receptor protein involved in Fe transport
LRTGVNNSGGWNVGGNFNYSSGKLDANVNVGYRKRKGVGYSVSEQHFLHTNTYQNTESEDDDSGQGIFTRANLTFHLSKKDELSFSGMAMFGNHDDLSEQPYYYGIIGNPEPSYVLWRTTTVDGKHNMLHGELGYTHEFGEKHKLTANLSWGRWKSDNDNFYQDALLYSDDDSNNSYSWQYRPLHINNRSWEAKLEYENQITDRWKLEAGYNGRFSHENTPQESWIDTENWEGTDKVEETAFFNRFIYDIDTHALYATVTTNIGKLGIMAGLRGEYWKVYTESLNYEQEHGLAPKDEPFKKDYFQLFPSLFLNYQFTPTAQIQLNYTRRLRRPWGGQLNSFRNTSDASIITYGNPMLTP